MNPLDKKNEVYGAKVLNREIGYYISRLEQYARSLNFFDKAVAVDSADLRTLTGRARARSKAAQYDGALEDINHALALDQEDMMVLGDKANNTYLCCEFEDGLVQNLRLLPKRQKPEVFRLGMMNCHEAIENCVGERAGRPLRDHFKIIRKLAWKKNFAAQKPFAPVAQGKSKKSGDMLLKKLNQQEQTKEAVQPKKYRTKRDLGELEVKDSLHSPPSDNERIPAYTQPFPFKPLQDYTTNIEDYMAEKYLDKMYLDKAFLKDIPNEPGSFCPNKKGTTKIKQIARNCFKTVAYKEELLRTRRPFYFIKYQEAKVSGELKERQRIELELQQEVTKKEADAIMGRMVQAYKEHRLRDFLVLTEQLRRYCASKPKRILTTKADYMNALNEFVCKAFYDVYRTNPNHSSLDKQMRIHATLGLPLNREPSKDSVIVQFKNVFYDYKKRIAEFESRLENATVAEEVCWAYHELSRNYLDLKRFDMSRLYAKKCIQEAMFIGNNMWVFNCAMLLCKNDLLQHNKSDARNDLNLAMKSAEKLKDLDKVVYIKDCLEMVDDVHFDDEFGAKELEKREQKIIRMMSNSNMKNEMAHLFTSMSAMPSSRRMTVIPGVQVKEKKKMSDKARSMSIMPKQFAEKSGKESEKSDRELMTMIELHM